MRPKPRSWAGLILGLVLIPLIAGLLACLPVPIGDPERSRVDLALEGVWIDEDFEAVWIVQPYDKRTWLIRAFGIVDTGSPRPGLAVDAGSYEELVSAMRERGIGDNGFTTDTAQTYKVWRTKFGKERLITWHTIGQFDEEGLFEPKYWLVWRLAALSADELILEMINGEYSDFKKVDKTRRDYERVIRRNMEDPSLFHDEPMRWIRVKDEHLGLFRELADEILAGAGD